MELLSFFQATHCQIAKKTYLEAQSILSAKDLLNIMHTLQMVCGLVLTYQHDWPELIQLEENLQLENKKRLLTI